MSVHFMSQKLDWQTPDNVYKILDNEFKFDFDPCPVNPDFDGLKIEWGQSNFVNPPYGREIPKWARKGYEEAQTGKTVVFLVPSRTDTSYWHDYFMKANEIRFIKGRLKFKGATNSAPFPSAIVIFKKEKGGPEFKDWWGFNLSIEQLEKLHKTNKEYEKEGRIGGVK